MRKPTTHAMQRFAGTIFVLIALLVACVGAGATPDASSATAGLLPQCAMPSDIADAAAFSHGEPADAEADAALPSIEDSGGGLDDSFDIPREHGIAVPHRLAAGPPGMVPDPHAHHPSLDLRPPIA